MIPPAGFKATLYPLRHKFGYSAGLSFVTETMNSTMFTLVKNYKTAGPAADIIVNPSNALFEVETGAICAPMSIIDKLKLTLRFNLTDHGNATNKIKNCSLSWTPIFFSFPEKLDAADDKTTDTVAAILSLTKDATNEDITPAFATKLPVDGTSDLTHPISTANLTESAAILNLTTDLTMEGVPFNQDRFFNALRYYTNKGALKACIGSTRNVKLSSTGQGSISKTFHINKFVPRAIRRIVPYTFFAILIHVPLNTQFNQGYYSGTVVASKSDIGVKALITYDEWNIDHKQEMVDPT